jgi:polysulfide reductase chain C
MMESLGRYDVALIVVEALLLYFYLSLTYKRSTPSVNALVRGTLAGYFWGGVVVLGLLVPFLLEVVGLTSGESVQPALAVTAGLFLLVGGLVLRAAVLAAGTRAPLFFKVPFYIRPGG